uniref:Rabphilin-1 n=1 Tax=Cajanus cajan TaxID=3821 RepID=A0A151TJT5_CAJCA|nr:Rabphilin-1 [Cajanus cajan]
MNNFKLGVDVVSAHNLLPKDGQGSSNAFVELYFDGQKFRTTIKERDLNPVWNESFYFNISDPSNLHYLTLDTASTYDLVERMYFLYVRVVKARELPAMDVTGSLDPFVEVRIGNYKGITKHFDKNQSPEWNQVFAFSKDRMQASVLDVVIKDKDLIKDDFVGIVRFDINEVPLRVPPDSPLAPEWYRLEDKKGEKIKGELMLAAQDLVPTEKMRFPDVYAKVQIGNQVLKTKTVPARTLSALWNEDLVFVAAEPFEDHLVISVEDRVSPGKDEIIGRVIIPLNLVERLTQLDMLRHQAMNILAARLGRAEPPLRKEVVEYMSDVDSHLWSMRRSKANFFRLMTVFSGVFAVGKWFGDICMYRPRYPPHMNTRISQAEAVHQDELDEEFDTFPTSRNPELVRMRYDRFYIMRHPRFRHRLPCTPVNFFRRLPARTDSML